MGLAKSCVLRAWGQVCLLYLKWKVNQVWKSEPGESSHLGYFLLLFGMETKVNPPLHWAPSSLSCRGKWCNTSQVAQRRKAHYANLVLHCVPCKERCSAHATRKQHTSGDLRPGPSPHGGVRMFYFAIASFYSYVFFFNHCIHSLWLWYILWEEFI